jgi:hypothetical protein
MLPPMQPAAHEPFPPIEAGALLVAITVLVIAVCTLGGWLAGSFTAGLVVGVLLGIPVGVFVVYRRYRGYFA